MPAFGFNTPFFEQLEFFRQKLNLPSERWDDILKSAHDRAFIVAGAMKADVVEDLRAAVDEGIELGTGLEAFRKNFRRIVQKHGWTGWTGEGSAAGEAWRTKVIYQTNMATSYAAGRYRQLTDPAFLALRPYWRYVHDDSVLYPRPHHLAWGNARLTLRHDHPFWQTHFPPCGWGCHCRCVPVAAPADGDATEPPAGWNERDAKGNLPGIDKGFDYAPGASTLRPLKDFIDQKLIRLDAPIGAAMYEALAPVLSAERAASLAAWVDDVLAFGKTRNLHAVVGTMTQEEIAYYARAVGSSPASAEIAIEDRLLVGKKAERHARDGDGLTADEWKSLPEALATDRRAYFDKQEQKIIYILPSGSDASVKLAVQVDFFVSRPKRALNMARAAYKINAQALKDRARYEEIAR